MAMLALGGMARAAGEISIVGFVYEPYVILKDGQATGIVPDIVGAAARRAGFAVTPTYDLPILRAFEMAKTVPNSFISLTATPDRLNDFTLVYCFLNDQMGGVWTRSKGWPSLADIPPSASFGNILGSVAPELLRPLGFSNFSATRLSEQNLEKLMAGRIDVWMAYFSSERYFLLRHGYKLDEFVFSQPLARADVCLATGKGTAPDSIAKWRAAFKAIIADGTYDAIREKYLDVFPRNSNPLPEN